MLTLHNGAPDYKNLAIDLAGNALPPGTVWIDLMLATPEEIAYVERATGLHVPTLAELSEIESSSRLRSEKDALILSTPSLLGLARIISYVDGLGGEWGTPDLHARLKTQRHDVASLSDYDGHLANKVQLLLDATMGLINIEQNNIIKVLTIVSVVGVPPTLVASMYGMNFRHMPELDWAWGYPYGLALIFLSAILPLLWFKLRGWL